MLFSQSVSSASIRRVWAARLWEERLMLSDITVQPIPWRQSAAPRSPVREKRHARATAPSRCYRAAAGRHRRRQKTQRNALSLRCPGRASRNGRGRLSECPFACCRRSFRAQTWALPPARLRDTQQISDRRQNLSCNVYSRRELHRRPFLKTQLRVRRSCRGRRREARSSFPKEFHPPVGTMLLRAPMHSEPSKRLPQGTGLKPKARPFDGSFSGRVDSWKAHNSDSGGPTCSIPYARNVFASMGAALGFVTSRKNASICPAGANAMSNLPGLSPTYAQTCGTRRGAQTESPGFSRSRS